MGFWILFFQHVFATDLEAKQYTLLFFTSPRSHTTPIKSCNDHNSDNWLLPRETSHGPPPPVSSGGLSNFPNETRSTFPRLITRKIRSQVVPEYPRSRFTVREPHKSNLGTPSFSRVNFSSSVFRFPSPTLLPPYSVFIIFLTTISVAYVNRSSSARLALIPVATVVPARYGSHHLVFFDCRLFVYFSDLLLRVAMYDWWCWFLWFGCFENFPKW